MDSQLQGQRWYPRFWALSLNVELTVWQEGEEEEREKDKIPVFRELRGRNKNNCSHVMWCLCHTAVRRGQRLVLPMVAEGGSHGTESKRSSVGEESRVKGMQKK